MMNQFNEEAKIEDAATNKKSMPVKAQIKKMEDDIVKLRNALSENMKVSSTVRTDFVSLESKVKDKCNDLSKALIDDLSNFDKDLKRVMQNDKNETDFFQIQTNGLNDDKIKLQKEVISLKARMKTCEIDIGVEPAN
jgi:hypothetical protein